MNYQTMETWELLAEKSRMEQLGFNGEVQLLDIEEELQRRKASSSQELSHQVLSVERGRYNDSGNYAMYLKKGSLLQVGEEWKQGKLYILFEEIHSIRETNKCIVFNEKHRRNKGTYCLTFHSYKRTS